MTMRSLAFLLIAGFALVLMVGEADAENESREYPNGWTHRPLVEHFGSLSASPDMTYAMPAINQIIADSENDAANPYNVISFRQRIGGDGDDPFHTEQSKSRMTDHYGKIATPFVQFDGKYHEESGGHEGNYQEYVQAIQNSGTREDNGNFEIVDLDIYCEFRVSEGVGQFEITVDILYHGTANSESNDDLEGSLYVFIAEDELLAYSSYLDEQVNNRMVFREYAIEDKEFTLGVGESTTYTVVWEIPITQIDGYGVSGNIKIPINPARLIPIAAVFNGNEEVVQSATPQSTYHDRSKNSEFLNVIHNSESVNNNGEVEIEISFNNDEIVSAYVIYFVKGNEGDGNETGTEDLWSFAPMVIDGNIGTAVINIENSLLYYHIVSFNSHNVFNASSLYSYVIVQSPEDDEDETSLPSVSLISSIAAIGIIALRRRY